MDTSRWYITLEFLEQGNIYFFYKPKMVADQVKSFADVSRFYYVLQSGSPVPDRYIVMGGKKLPRTDDDGRSAWGMVQTVGGRGFEVTRPGMERKGASRAAGEGLYAFVRHGNHTHFVYVLELPPQLGEVQKAFRIGKAANYVMVARPSPRLTQDQREYLNVPDTRKYYPLLDMRFLNTKGTSILLTSGTRNVERLGISVDRERETEETANIFNQLKVSKERHPIEPLLYGKWR